MSVVGERAKNFNNDSFTALLIKLLNSVVDPSTSFLDPDQKKGPTPPLCLSKTKKASSPDPPPDKNKVQH